MVDSPLLTGVNLDARLGQIGVRYAVAENIRELSAEERSRAVIVVQDAFTSYFETEVVVDLLSLLKQLGFTPLLAPFKPNGKPLHVHGFLKGFEKTANNTGEFLNSLSNTGIPLVGVDPSMTLAFRSEYQKILGDQAPKVELLQEWLATHTEQLTAQAERFNSGDFKLLAHCTEKTNAAASLKDWGTVFTSLGQELSMVDVGCCGMAGTYGHEAKNAEMSKHIYDLSWSKAVNASENQGKLMATGYSCRSQAKRIDDLSLPHPFQVLLQQLH